MTDKLLPCPFCGGEAKIYGENMVGCADTLNCGANVDFGHWCGTDAAGVPAVKHVIDQWNTRASGWQPLPEPPASKGERE